MFCSFSFCFCLSNIFLWISNLTRAHRTSQWLTSLILIWAIRFHFLAARLTAGSVIWCVTWNRCCASVNWCKTLLKSNARLADAFFSLKSIWELLLKITFTLVRKLCFFSTNLAFGSDHQSQMVMWKFIPSNLQKSDFRGLNKRLCGFFYRGYLEMAQKDWYWILRILSHLKV